MGLRKRVLAGVWVSDLLELELWLIFLHDFGQKRVLGCPLSYLLGSHWRWRRVSSYMTVSPGNDTSMG